MTLIENAMIYLLAGLFVAALFALGGLVFALLTGRPLIETIKKFLSRMDF